MSHSYTNLLYHIVFGTKERHPWLGVEIRPQLFAFLGGIIREEGGVPIIINGMPDHVHILAKLRQDRTVADSIRVMKATSSNWFHRDLPDGSGFGWQTGYGAFSVSPSQVEVVREYIRNQEEHHRRMPFPEEYLRLLAAHGVTVTEADLWG